MTTVDVSPPLAHVGPPARHDGYTRLGPAVARVATRVRADLPLVGLDGALTAGCYFAALVLRFDGAVPARYWDRFPALVVLALLAHIGGNRAFGLYRQMWRHASVAEARCVIGSAVTATTLLWIASALTVHQPVSVVVVGGAGAMMLTGAVRFQSRLFAFHRGRGVTAGTRVAVLGAGESGALILREMRRDPSAGLVPVAVLDDDRSTHGLSLAGVPVVGPIAGLTDVVRRFDVQQVVLAIPSADQALLRQVANLAEAAEVAVKLTPRVGELLGDQVSVRDVRELRIEDLLGRAEVATDLDAVRALLRGRRVLITGAGGSIGSEIARQVALCEPERLIMLDHDETHLFEAAATLSCEPVQILADIRDAAVLRQALARHRPHVVFHAAAHKHVPLLEHHPCEAVATNVVGTANLLAAAQDVAVERLVFISTDKAVCPTSVMGASKWLGEQMVMAASSAAGRHCAVRFGNVAGSRGSVIPTFARQIAAGGPVTVTDPEMTRYFMSVHESVELVLQAAALAEGGEVFMLEMGEPVKILELAERMIRLSGRSVGSEVAVVVTGARPGEKLCESLRGPSETAHATEHSAILRLRPPALDAHTLDEGVRRLASLAARGREKEVARQLFALVEDSGHAQPQVIDLAAMEAARTG